MTLRLHLCSPFHQCFAESVAQKKKSKRPPRCGKVWPTGLTDVRGSKVFATWGLRSWCEEWRMEPSEIVNEVYLLYCNEVDCIYRIKSESLMGTPRFHNCLIENWIPEENFRIWPGWLTLDCFIHVSKSWRGCLGPWAVSGDTLQKGLWADCNQA